MKLTLKTTCVSFLTLVLWVSAKSSAADHIIDNVADLVVAAENGRPGTKIVIAAGNYKLTKPLELRSGATLIGAGVDKTVITHTAAWKPSTASLPKGEMRPEEADPGAYLIRLQDKAQDITIANLTLLGPQMHGAIFGIRNEHVHLHHLQIENVLYSGIRCYFMRDARIHDCDFIGAGGKWKRGGNPRSRWRNFRWGDLRDLDGRYQKLPTIASATVALTADPARLEGTMGSKDAAENTSTSTTTRSESISRSSFRFEGRSGNRDRPQHPARCGFDSEVWRGCRCSRTGQRSFHIHHNYFTTSYAIEFRSQRRGNRSQPVRL